MEEYITNISSENVVLNSRSESVSKTSLQGERPSPVTKQTRKYSFVTYNEALENLSTPSEVHLNEKKFLDKNNERTREFINSVQKEVAQCLVRGSIEDTKLRGRKDKSFTVWVLLKESTGELKIDGSFLSKACKYNDLKVTAMTVLVSPEEERGLRVSLNENKARLYEIINGSHTITFNWKINDADRHITISVSDGGTVVCSNPSENLTYVDLNKNKDVKIRIGCPKNKEMTLTELVLLSEQCKSFGEVVVDQSSNVDTLQQQH